MSTGTLIATITALVAVFLFAITKFSHQIERNAGPKFRSFIHHVTGTPITGALAGFVTSAVSQSSSVTSVLAVSLAEAGMLSFSGSLGVIIGANVGTTITSQLVAFKLTAIAPYFVILGLVLHYTPSSFRRYGKPIFYFGLLFFTLFLMQDKLATLAQTPFMVRFLTLSSAPILAALVGAFAALIFQSSTLVTTIAILLVGSGGIPFSQALPIILGANVGTTSTAIIASLPLSARAREVAVAHAIFNVVGSVVFMFILNPFSKLIYFIGGTPEQYVANAHLIFNATCAIVALLLFPLYERATRFISVWFEKVVAPLPRNHELS